MIGVLSSVPFESDLLHSEMRHVQDIDIAGKKAHQGLLAGQEVLLMHSGIGKINAAHASTSMIERFSPKGIINIGIGGSYPGSGLKNGDIAIASSEVYGDEGVFDGDGWSGYEKIGIPLARIGDKDYFNEFPVRMPDLQSLSSGTVREGDLNLKAGRFVSVSAASGSEERALELGARFEAICENMEGAAMAHVCLIYGLPFYEIRGISNRAGERDKANWDMKGAAENCQRFVLDIADILVNSMLD